MELRKRIIEAWKSNSYTLEQLTTTLFVHTSTVKPYPKNIEVQKISIRRGIIKNESDRLRPSGGLTEKHDKRTETPYKVIPSGTPDRCVPGQKIHDAMVPMRDGVKLATDIYLPQEEGPFPVILTRIPYGKREPYCEMPLISEFWTKKGYAFVVQDVRGKWGSEGVFEPNSKKNEIADGYDTIGWITQQPWSNRRLGMWGESYYGFTTYAGAVSQHPDLVCIAPGDISLNRYQCTFRNGALQLNTLGMWSIYMMAREYQDTTNIDPWHLPLAEMGEAGGIPSSYFDQVIANPVPGSFWEERSLLEGYESIRIPVLHWSGWYDSYTGPAIKDWSEISRRNSSAGHNHLFIGPWDHEGTADEIHRVGGLDVGQGTEKHRWDTYQSFFDHYLMGLSDDSSQIPKVHIFVMGENVWRDEQAWPLEQTRFTEFYLHSNGKANSLNGDGILNMSIPGEEQADTYVYDPTNPIDNTLYLDCYSIAGEMGDRSEIEERQDVLVYSTDKLDSDMEITGPLKAKLFAASSAVDTDFTVTLVDVFENEYANLIQDGIIRASYRDSDLEPSPIIPGKIYEYTVDLWATSYVVKKGHRLRVEVSSSCFNRYDRNTNTGEPFGKATGTVLAKQTVFHSREYPSHIILPLIPK